MGLFKDIVNEIFGTPKQQEAAKNDIAPIEHPNREPMAHYDNYSYARHWTLSYDGEKNIGEVGPAKNYIPDYETLRVRSWEAYLTSDSAQIVLGRLNMWAISTGLRLNAQPNTEALALFGINVKRQDISNSVEALWKLWSKSKNSHQKKNLNLLQLQSRAFMNAIIGGDVLVVLRLVNNVPTVQLIDGMHVKTPGVYNPNIRSGVEYDNEGKIVAYHVCKGLNEFERIEAKNESLGLTQAFLVYGLPYRLDDSRGLPLLSAVIEKAAKMDRYMEATLGSAEERRKVAYTIEHNQHSTGENPLTKSFITASNPDKVFDLPIDDLGNKLAANMAVSTNKQVFNLPIGSKVAALDNQAELYFRDFYTINFDFFCAAVSVPPNVALQKYDSNFSASRAALKDWENTLTVYRDRFATEFMQPIYDWFFHVYALRNMIQAPGYLSNGWEVREAYRQARFIGVNVPHIDPVKEVEAERRKLGTAADHLPLTTIEDAVEALGGSESDSILEQFSEETKYAKQLGLEPPARTNQAPPSNQPAK